MRRLRYSVPYIAGKKLPKDSDPAPRGAGQSCGTGRPNWPNFNPPAPCGAGPSAMAAGRRSANFNPPAGDRSWEQLAGFQSTRPLRGGTVSAAGSLTPEAISIHPPLAGRDDRPDLTGRAIVISIHPPLAGRDRGRLRSCAHGTIFQSTRPLRGGTWIDSFRFVNRRISIHPPLAGRDDRPDLTGRAIVISIHPPLAGRDGRRF